MSGMVGTGLCKWGVCVGRVSIGYSQSGWDLPRGAFAQVGGGPRCHCNRVYVWPLLSLRGPPSVGAPCGGIVDEPSGSLSGALLLFK